MADFHVWGRAAAGSAVEPVGAGERRCALVRARAPPISFGRDGWFGCSVQGAGIGFLGRGLGLDEWSQRS